MRQRVWYQGCVVFEGECRGGICKVLKGLDGMAGRLAKRLRIVDDSLGERSSLNIRKTFRSSSYATPINNTGNPNTVETKADHIEP